jgi:hypothetical protein
MNSQGYYVIVDVKVTDKYANQDMLTFKFDFFTKLQIQKEYFDFSKSILY